MATPREQTQTPEARQETIRAIIAFRKGKNSKKPLRLVSPEAALNDLCDLVALEPDSLPARWYRFADLRQIGLFKKEWRALVGNPDIQPEDLTYNAGPKKKKAPAPAPSAPVTESRAREAHRL